MDPQGVFNNITRRGGFTHQRKTPLRNCSRPMWIAFNDIASFMRIVQEHEVLSFAVRLFVIPVHPTIDLADCACRIIFNSKYNGVRCGGYGVLGGDTY